MDGLSKEIVLDFISGMKAQHREEIIELFSHGYCYWFAHILAERFNGRIWYNPVRVHFAAEVFGNLYDIYGGVDDYPDYDPYWFPWEEYQEELYRQGRHEEIQVIVDECIKKIKVT